MRPLALILATVALAACVSEPGQSVDVHTGTAGTAGAFSREYPAASTLLSNLTAGAIVATRGGETRYGVGIRYTATGTGWANFTAAWSYGQALPYKVTTTRVAGCGGGCTIIEQGTITLTREQFDQAARAGFEFKLEGSGQSVIGRLPAAAFQEALGEL
jgi:hypothetical protein